MSNLRKQFGRQIILPDARLQPAKEAGILKWMWFFTRPYKAVIFFSFFLRMLRYTVYGLTTYFFGLIIDALQNSALVNNAHHFWMNTAFISVFYLIVMVSFQFLYFESTATDKMQRGLTLFSIRHLLSLSLDWHEQQGSGGKLQRVMQARDNMRNIYFLFARRILFFFGEITAITFAVIMMNVPIYMLLIFAAYVVSYLFLFWYMNKPINALNEEHNTLKEKLVSRIYDFISLIRVSKAFSLDQYVMDRSNVVENAAHIIQRKLKFIQNIRWTLINMNVWFWGMIIIVLGLHQVSKQVITVGAFSAMIFMAYRLWNTLEEVVVAQIDYFEYKAGFLRIRETLGAALQNYDVEPVVQTPMEWNRIECRDLQFYYHADQPVLKNINLKISRGQRIALIGHSGAGKSTMVKLLMKQVQPVDGDIFIGIQSLKNIDSNDWLSQLALVPQDVELMNATLRENILLDQDEVDEEFYRECLRKAYLEDFVVSLPQGDATEIGERGVKLSGGQKQRLGIARALVRNAQIIIFDEATSSLDSESEAFIQRAMETAFTDKTVIVIAHRLSTIRHADMIYVFDKGVIAESGDFATLEKSGGIFSRLWSMQSNGFIAN